jgi:hypothetical protein
MGRDFLNLAVRLSERILWVDIFMFITFLYDSCNQGTDD